MAKAIAIALSNNTFTRRTDIAVADAPLDVTVDVTRGDGGQTAERFFKEADGTVTKAPPSFHVTNAAGHTGFLNLYTSEIERCADDGIDLVALIQERAGNGEAILAKCTKKAGRLNVVLG